MTVSFGQQLWQGLVVEMWPTWLMLGALMAVATVFGTWYRRNVLKIREGGHSLEEALAQGECETIEFKSEISDSVAKTIGAFANGRGGTIFVGVTDSGTVCGLPMETKSRDFYLSQVSNITRQRIDPPAKPACTFLECDGKTVLKIWVPRTGDPVHFVDGAVYLRHINSSSRAGAAEVMRIFRNHFTRDRG